MMALNEMIDWIRNNTKATFSPGHPGYQTVNWDNDLLEEVFGVMGVNLQKLEKHLGDGPSGEWVSMLHAGALDLIERHFDHVPNKLWLRQLLVQHPELLTPQFHAINVDLAMHIEAAIGDDLRVFAEELQTQRDIDRPRARSI